jgi:hypothetical protein
VCGESPDLLSQSRGVLAVRHIEQAGREAFPSGQISARPPLHHFQQLLILSGLRQKTGRHRPPLLT